MGRKYNDGRETPNFGDNGGSLARPWGGDDSMKEWRAQSSAYSKDRASPDLRGSPYSFNASLEDASRADLKRGYVAQGAIEPSATKSDPADPA